MKNRLFEFFDYASEISIYFLIIFMPISNAAIESIFGFLFLFFLIKKIIKPDFKHMKSGIYLSLLSFAFFMGLSVLNSGSFLIISLKAFFLKWMEYLLMFIAVDDALRNNYRRIKNCVMIMIAMSLAVCIDAIIQKYTGIDIFRARSTIPLATGKVLCGLTASFRHYNSLGSYLVFCVPLLLTAIIRVRRFISKIGLIMALFLMLTCLVFTFSRGAWFSLLILMIILFTISLKRSYLVLILVFIVSLIIFSPNKYNKDMFSDSGRLPVWKLTLKMIKSHPILGWGVGTYINNYKNYTKQPTSQYAHNSYLQVWAETGPLSLISFILFASLLISKGIITFKRYRDPLMLGLIGAIFGFLVHCLVDVNLYSIQLSALFWTGAGLLNASATSQKPNQ